MDPTTGESMENTKVMQLYQDVTLNNIEDESIFVRDNIIEVGTEDQFSPSTSTSINTRIYDFGGHQGNKPFL